MKNERVIRQLHKKYPQIKLIDLVSLYYYSYTRLMCLRKHMTLSDVSYHYRHHRSYFSNTYIRTRYRKTLNRTYVKVLRFLKVNGHDNTAVNHQVRQLIPQFLKRKNWREFFNHYITWQKLEPLTPLARAVKSSDLTIADIAQRRHVLYETVIVSLKGGRVSLPTMFDTAKILGQSPLKLMAEYHMDLSKKQRDRLIYIDLHNYLHYLNDYRAQKHLKASREILRTYLCRAKSLKEALQTIFHSYKLLHLTLLTCLRWLPQCQDIQLNSPAMTYIKILQTSNACAKHHPLADKYFSYPKIYKILGLRKPTDSIPLYTAKLIYQRYRTTIRFPKINSFYNLRYQFMYEHYLQKMSTKANNIAKSNGIRLTKFRCEHGITLSQLGKKVHLSEARIRQLANGYLFSESHVKELNRTYPQLNLINN